MEAPVSKLRRCRSVLTRAALVGAAVAATSLLGAPAAAANGGPPQGGGGCHMVTSPSSSGLSHMMAGSAHGEGAGKMIEMLARFSPVPFCGL
jgi:hypothetical protein